MGLQKRIRWCRSKVEVLFSGRKNGCEGYGLSARTSLGWISHRAASLALNKSAYQGSFLPRFSPLVIPSINRKALSRVEECVELYGLKSRRKKSGIPFPSHNFSRDL